MPNTTMISKLARVLAAVAVVAATVWLGPPAHAAVAVDFTDCPLDPTPSPSPDEEQQQSVCVPRHGSVVTGEVVPRFTVTADGFNRIREIRLYVLSEDVNIQSPGDPEPGDPVKIFSWPSFSGAPQQFEHPQSAAEPFVWDTRELTPYNGAYTFKVVATSHEPDGQTAEKQRTNILVDYAPVRPDPPEVVSVEGRQVSVRWDEAPEPDVVGYYLYPARTNGLDQPPADSAFKPEDRIFVDGTTYVHEVSQGGAWWYKLRVARHSARDPKGIWSDPSGRSVQGGFVDLPTVTPSPAPAQQTTRGGGSLSEQTVPRRRARPALTARPIVRSNRPAPVDDAPYSAILPYDLPESEDRSGSASFTRPEVRDEEAAQQVLPIVAAGLFLVSAALAIGRMPT